MPAYAKKLWKSINENFIRQYTVMLIRLTNDYKSSTINELVTKSNKEHFFIKDVFAGNLNHKDMEEAAQFLALYPAILTDPPVSMVDNIVKLSIKLKDLYNENTLVANIY